MRSEEIRKRYLTFFEKRGHTILPSASLVPENDPTTLFTGSGMQPLIPYLLGEKHPQGKRLANSQKCFRSQDIEEVGDNRHTTFFEMLGNWSLGDYWKEEQLSLFFEFLTKEAGIDKNRLWVTCFEGDASLGLSRDDESAEIWKRLGIPDGQIRFYSSKKNWWSRSGIPENMPVGEPGGPDSEVFFDFGEHAKLHEQSPWKNEQCHPNCDCGRFMEIGNSVFMQYIKKEDGSFGLLPTRNVDFGGGLERITAASQGESDIFVANSDYIIGRIEQVTGAAYAENRIAFRIIADHIKAAVFLIGDGILPSNKDQGYFVRRLLRRAMVHLSKLSPNIPLTSFIQGIVEAYKTQYPVLAEKQTAIEEAIALEEARFTTTLGRGMKEFERLAKDGAITAQDAFQLFTTYGFPVELIVEEARARGIKQLDLNGLQELLRQHQELSRAGAEQKFKGGLADTKPETVKLHTTHHLLLAALQRVLGPHVKQRGSNITSERLRIDFSHPQKMTKEEIAQVETLVNEQIKKGLKMVRRDMPKEEAEKIGAEMEFGANYADIVSVYFCEDEEGNVFSKEFCGGPHVKNTADIQGTFKIMKEEAVSAGVRRIKAVIE
ncbi:MAG: alanine--tRNA ligase [Parcubacteria group bacterium]|nr:alanine--tRNA ligase [Parcubacteria group bacterium]